MQIHTQIPVTTDTDTTDDEIEMIPRVHKPQVKITIKVIQPPSDPISVEIMTTSEVNVLSIIKKVGDEGLFKGLWLFETDQYELFKEGNTYLKHNDVLKGGTVLTMRKIE